MLCRRPRRSTTGATGTTASSCLSADSISRSVSICCCAAAAEQQLEVVVAGEGPDRARLEELAANLGLDGRVSFAGRVDEGELTNLYARCLAVYYAPVDEDLGFVPYEAFLSEKPVITTRDAGGPLEVVTDRRQGSSASRRPRAIAAGLRAGSPPTARKRVSSGTGARLAVQQVTWEAAIRPAARDVRVAYYSPLPPERSGIADYSALLLPALERRIDVEVAGRRRRASAWST